jgi:hypothetical protein
MVVRSMDSCFQLNQNIKRSSWGASLRMSVDAHQISLRSKNWILVESEFHGETDIFSVEEVFHGASRKGALR